MNENRAIPPGLNLEQLTLAVNDRLRELDHHLRRVVENPARADLRLAHQRIVAMGDPKDDLDGVNLRTLRRFTAPVPLTEPGAGVEAGEALPVAYTAVFTKDGLVADGELSPWFTVNQLREGDPVVASLSASIAPSINPLLVQFRVYPPSGGSPYDLFAQDFKLNPGQTGPVFTTGFANAARLAVGAYVEMRIVSGGSAEKVVGELVLRRPAT